MFCQLPQMFQQLFLLLILFHVDEIHDDDAANVPQAQLPHDFLSGLLIGSIDRFAQIGRARILARVHINHCQRLGLVNDQKAARFQFYDSTAQIIHFFFDAIMFK